MAKQLASHVTFTAAIQLVHVSAADLREEQMRWQRWIRGNFKPPAQPNRVALTSGENDPNDHLRNYLAFYLGLTRAPGFAVLLSGLWGSGKTFQAKKILNELVGAEGYVLISLNGISSRRELDDAVFAAIYPWTQARTLQIGTALAKAVLKHAKIDLPDLSSEKLSNTAATGANPVTSLLSASRQACPEPVERLAGIRWLFALLRRRFASAALPVCARS